MRRSFIALLCAGLLAPVALSADGAPRGKRPPSAAAPSVELYITSWCGFCRKARSFLQARGVDYVEYDVERDAEAAARFKAYGGRGVPLAVINGDVVYGFSENAYEGALGLK